MCARCGAGFVPLSSDGLCPPCERDVEQGTHTLTCDMGGDCLCGVEERKARLRQAVCAYQHKPGFACVKCGWYEAKDCGVAQSAEQRSVQPMVAGSTPAPAAVDLGPAPSADSNPARAGIDTLGVRS